MGKLILCLMVLSLTVHSVFASERKPAQTKARESAVVEDSIPTLNPNSAIESDDGSENESGFVIVSVTDYR